MRLLQSQGEQKFTRHNFWKNLSFLINRTANVHRRTTEPHAGKERARRQGSSCFFRDDPESLVPEANPTVLLGEGCSCKSEFGHRRPCFSIKTVRIVFVPKPTELINRRLIRTEGLCHVFKLVLFFIENHRHLISPRIILTAVLHVRLCIIFNCVRELHLRRSMTRTGQHVRQAVISTRQFAYPSPMPKILGLVMESDSCSGGQPPHHVCASSVNERTST